jgi:hypothetical protein
VDVSAARNALNGNTTPPALIATLVIHTPPYIYIHIYTHIHTHSNIYIHTYTHIQKHMDVSAARNALNVNPTPPALPVSPKTVPPAHTEPA